VTGGAGDDTLIGSQGGDDFLWNPGDGSDTIDGQGGLDALTFNGSEAAENIVLARSGSRVRLSDDVGNVTKDLNAVDGIQVNALGGADTITVNDLTGTGLVKVQLNLSGPVGGGDGQADNVVVNGTDDDDAIRVAAAGNTILVDGLFPLVRITGSDGPSDQLTVNTLGGNDTVDSSGLPANLIGLTVNPGVQPAAGTRTTTTLQTSTATSLFGQTVLLTATVNSPTGAATGSVVFLDGDTELGIVRINGVSAATLPVSLGVGDHVLKAVFRGLADFADSTSAVVDETVNRAATTTTLSPSANPAVGGQPVTFTATVTAVAPGAGTPTGTVTLLDGNTVLGTAALGADGRATFTTTFAAASSHALAAIYNGDGNFLGSAQTVVEQVRVPLPPPPVVEVQVKRVGRRTRVVVVVDRVLRRRFFPFGTFTGRVRVVQADVNSDGLLDVIAQATINGKKRTRTFLT
jgi:hypothetical protein